MRELCFIPQHRIWHDCVFFPLFLFYWIGNDWPFFLPFFHLESKRTLSGLSGKENREWCISRTNWMLNVWRQNFMEEENTGLHFWVYSDKNWTLEPFTDKSWPKRRQGAKHQGSFLYLVLCWWGNSSCTRQKWGDCVLVPLSPCHYLTFIHIPAVISPCTVGKYYTVYIRSLIQFNTLGLQLFEVLCVSN